MSVLIIEPSKELANILCEALEAKKIQAFVANSAQGGVIVADKNSPDLVILEIIMPDHNGLEFIHEFKSYSDWFDVPIVIYSDISPAQFETQPQILAEMNIIKHFYKPTTSLEELSSYIAGVVNE
jgi:two-component system KDP operon response regulator KdpE